MHILTDTDSLFTLQVVAGAVTLLASGVIDKL